VVGATVVHLSALELEAPRQLPGASFTAEALDPESPRRLLFLHRERGLSATVVLRGNEREPVTVTLRPMAGFRGRALSADGKPLAGYCVDYSHTDRDLIVLNFSLGFVDDPARTDAEGRFRVAGVPAGVPIRVHLGRDRHRPTLDVDKLTLKAGEIKDLGDLREER
jgi:hypothetical protein